MTNVTTAEFWIKCATSLGEIQKKGFNITIDTTPPTMSWVRDNTTLPGDPEVWYEDNNLWVSFFGKDNESYISKYQILLRESGNNSIVVNWTESTQLEGKRIKFSNLNLSDGQQYFFTVRAMNRAGVLSNPMDSNGVTIDTSMVPELCANGFLDQDETDMDCGGTCGATCGNNSTCSANADCSSGVCSSGRCSAPGW